jgi:TrfA protein
MATSKVTKTTTPSTKTAGILARAHQRAAEAVERIEAAAAAGKRAEAKAKRETKKAQLVKLTQLPLWPEYVRGVPNAVLRGALFTVSKERETFSKRTLIATVENLEIRYLGTRLNQLDLDVWETLMHLARLQPLSSEIRFTAHSMLKELGRGTSGKHHEELKEQIARLAGGLAEITWKKEKKTFMGTLISSVFRDEDSGIYVVKFNRDFGKLYAHGHTSIDWGQRQSLGQHNLAKWMHGFYSSHEKPYSYKVETLQRLCGSQSQRREFRRMLKFALDLLVFIGFLSSWEIDAESDLVTATKKKPLKQIK